MLNYKENTTDVFDVVYDDELPDSEPANPDQPITQSFTPKEACLLSINRLGRIDLDYMAGICRYSRDELIDRLEGVVIWKDPRVFDPASPYDGWITREQYVRGNVYRLLDEARAKDGGTGLYRKNIELLEASLPEGPARNEIMISLGATWVPARYYLAFICDLLLMHPKPPTLELDTFFGKWSLKGQSFFNRLRLYHTYGTSRMSALRIIEHTMNASPLRVFDSVEDPRTGKKKSVLNQAETMAVREKQNLILREFQEWLKKNPKVRRKLEDIYTDKYGYQLCHFDGSYLEFPGMNPEISLYDHQKAAIARIILSRNNVLLSHDVGAGKTYAFIAGIHERLRMGLSRKALLVVPNGVFEATVAAVRLLYPEEDFVPVSPKDFVPKKREDALKKLMDTERGFYVLASSSFDMIGISRKYFLRKKEKELAECLREINAASDYARKYKLLGKYEQLQKQYEKIREQEERFADCFDRMGFDLLVVDECHNYKNISLKYNMEPLTGLHAKGSKKADLMLEKCDCVRQGGGKLVFATGTPLTNSMAELFVLQRYLQPEELKFLNISRFNEWVNTFCTRHTDFEIDVTAASFRFVTRLDRFHNLPELMALFGNVCDFYRIDPEKLDLPEFHGYTNITVPRSKEQGSYIKRIAGRTEKIRKHQVKRTEDNYLKITSDGRKCALDIRLVMPDLVGRKIPADSKIEKASLLVRQIYEEYPGMTQVIFCDFSTPGKAFNLYDEMKKLLVEAGIPAEEIAFIHDASTGTAREKMFRRFNSGKLRILLGSTQKLGLGVNIQEKLIAVHHIDAPWKPSDMVQREGRAIRHGNSNEEVLVYRYVTESSFDAYLWQILENKQRFISSFLSGNLDRTHRSEEDIGDMVLDYSEIKALAIGNPLIKERVEIANRIGRIRVAAVRRREELHGYQKVLLETPEVCRRVHDQIEAISDDIAFYEKRKTPLPRAERRRIGERILQRIAANLQTDREMPICGYRGFRISTPRYQTPDRPYVLVYRHSVLRYQVDMKDAQTGGCCMRVDHVLSGLPVRREKFLRKLEGLYGDMEDAKKQLDQGNPYETQLEKYKKKLENIDKQLKEEIGNENK